MEMLSYQAIEELIKSQGFTLSKIEEEEEGLRLVRYENELLKDVHIDMRVGTASNLVYLDWINERDWDLDASLTRIVRRNDLKALTEKLVFLIKDEKARLQ